MCKEKWPKTSVNAFWLPKFPAVIGNRCRWIQQRCHYCKRKLRNWRFCACAVEMWPKSTKNVAKSSTFSMKRWRMAINAFRSSKFSTLIRSRDCWIKWRCQNCGQKLGNCLFCACALKCGEKTTKLCQIVKILVLSHYRKSTSLKTTVTTDFRSELEIMPLPRTCRVNEPTQL